MNQKKLTFIINDFAMGGVERLLFDIVSELKKDYQVSIITVVGSGPLLNTFRDISIPVYHVGTPFKSNKSLLSKIYWMLTLPLTLIRIMVILNRVKPDVIFTSLYQADLVGMLSSRLLGIKKRILIQHDVQKFSFLRKILRYIFAIKLSTQIIAISDTVRSFLQKYYSVSLDKISVIKNGINTEKFLSCSKAFDDKDITFGFIGRLERVKGCINILKSAHVLKVQYNLEPKIIIGGHGSEKDYLENYSSQKFLRNVSFVGYVEDPSDFLKKIDILIVPSLEEGFGLVALEGMIANKIVIASNIDSFREFIKHGDNGLLFRLDIENDLADNMRDLFMDPLSIKRLKSNLNIWIENNSEMYSIKRTVSEYKEIIDSAPAL